MKKKQLWTLLTLLSATVLLVACSNDTKQAATSQSSTEASSVETKKTPEEAAQEDAEVLLGAMLTSDDKGFSRLYGSQYDTWTDKEVFPSQAEDFIDENELTPEDELTFTYAEDMDELTPTDIATRFLTTRRDNLKDIGEFEITEVELNDDQNLATVTVKSHHINNTASANAVTNLYLILFDGNIDALGALNQGAELDANFKKIQTLMSFFLYYANFDNLLMYYDDVPERLNETPLTEGEYEVTFDLELDSDDNWVISVDDYRALVSDMLNDDETADQIIYPDGTTHQEHKDEVLGEADASSRSSEESSTSSSSKKSTA